MLCSFFLLAGLVVCSSAHILKKTLYHAKHEFIQSRLLRSSPIFNPRNEVTALSSSPAVTADTAAHLKNANFKSPEESDIALENPPVSTPLVKD